MIKCIVCDLDGTLIKYDDRIVEIFEKASYDIGYISFIVNSLLQYCVPLFKIKSQSNWY